MLSKHFSFGGQESWHPAAVKVSHNFNNEEERFKKICFANVTFREEGLETQRRFISHLQSKNFTMYICAPTFNLISTHCLPGETFFTPPAAHERIRIIRMLGSCFQVRYTKSLTDWVPDGAACQEGAIKTTYSETPCVLVLFYFHLLSDACGFAAMILSTCVVSASRV